MQEHRPAWFQFVAHQFRDPSLGGGLRRKDVAGIEYLLRRGEKMLESYKGNSVTKVGLPDGLYDSKLGWVAKGGKKAKQST
jgi:succinate dehydrogenase assembly factor 1